MKTKLQQLRDFMATGDYRPALRLAASWSELGGHKAAIGRGWAAIVHPQFYIDIDQNPEELVAAGLAAIRERYDIPE